MNEPDDIAKAQKMVDQFPDNEIARFSLGKALFNTDQFAQAREQFGIALAKKPDWMAVQILIGKCDLALGDKVAAKAAFRVALQMAIAQHHEGPQMEMEQALADLA